MSEFRLSPFETAKLLVKERLRSGDSRIFRLPALRQLVESAISPWPYENSRRPRTGKVIEDLIAEKTLRHLTLKSSDYSPISRYAYGTVSLLELATSLKSKAYISHWSAAQVHGLSARTPPTIYVNHEQSAKRQPESDLSQEAIDRAFARPQRQSKYIFEFDTQTFTILSGKNTGDFGVAPVSIGGRRISVTNIPRTLIDIAVRPAYAGGVRHVAEVYKEAVHSVKIRTLVKTLHAIGHRYPFHQSIGYYLSSAGVPLSELEPLREMGIHHRFYLDYDMTDPHFDDVWQVYVPT